MKLPALRGVDAFTVEMDGETMIGVRDPEGIVEDQLLMSRGAFVVAAFLDGERDEKAIQEELAKHFHGQVFAEQDILKVAMMLDEHGFLNSEKFQEIRSGVQKRFAEQSVRPAYLAGKSYPNTPEELRLFLDGLFWRDGSPNRAPFKGERISKPLKCLIAPHLDLHRGGHAYAWAYGHLSLCPKPETIIIFGTAHASPPVPFILTRKSFETPFGTITTDSDAVDRLAKSCQWNPFEYELLHRTEHSIEFQVLMLSYLYGTSFKIVPVLCGSYYENSTRESRDFFHEAKRILEEAGDSALVIAGADLAHVGKRYGDAFDIDDEVIHRVDLRDQEDIRIAVECDPDAFYQSVMKDSNERRVCGLNNIYAALKILPSRAQGKLLHYGYAHDPLGGIVSFVSIAY